MKYKTWKRKTLKSKKFRRAYIKMLEKFLREYERHFLAAYGELPDFPKDIRRIGKR